MACTLPPEMPIAVAEVAKPASAGERLELERHGSTIGHFIPRAKLLKKSRKGYIEGRGDVDLLLDEQGETFNI